MLNDHRRLAPWFSVVVCIAASTFFAATTQGDMIPGVKSHAQNATAVLLAHVPTATEAATLPPELKDALIIDQTVKGFDTRRHLLHVKEKLPEGQQVIVLIPFPETRFDLVARPPSHADISPVLWPIYTSIVDTRGVPLQAEDEANFDTLPTPDRNAVLSAITDSASEEVGLQSQLIDRLLFPNRFALLATRNPDRAAFIRLACAARDLDRDVPNLANLLESPDADIRAAAAKRLHAITGVEIPIPTKSDPASLHLHAQAWRDWWMANQPTLVWNEVQFAFIKPGKDRPPFSAPPIPADLILTQDAIPHRVIDALRGKDAKPDLDAFAPAFRAFLDDCLLRDLYLKTITDSKANFLPANTKSEPPPWFKTTGIALNEIAGSPHTPFGCLVQASGFPNCVLGGSGPYLPSAPRLRQDLLLNPDIPVENRAALISLFAFSLFNNDRFVADRRQAIACINRPDADMQLVRRTAFWDVASSPDDDDAPGNAAENRLAQSIDPNDQKLLAEIFLQRPTACSVTAIRHSIDAKHELFIQILLEHLRKASGPSFQWPGRFLAQQHEVRVIPILRIRLHDADASVRLDASFNLCWIPSRDATPDLLVALHKESVPNVKTSILTAISQGDDPRALNDLIAAARATSDQNLLIELCRGLARIRDAKALPVLGTIALHAGNDQSRGEAIAAFGYISGLFKGASPSTFWTSGGMNPQDIQDDLPLIQNWMADHPVDRKN